MTGSDGHVGAGDGEESSVGNGLDGGVEEGRGGSVRIEVDHVHSVGTMRVHEHAERKDIGTIATLRVVSGLPWRYTEG